MKTAGQILEMHFGSDFYQLKELDFQVHIISAMKEYAQRIAEQVRQDCADEPYMVKEGDKLVLVIRVEDVLSTEIKLP